MVTTANATAPAPATAPATLAAIVATLVNTLATFARYHTRSATAFCSYHVAGCKGIVYMPCAMLGTGVPNATLAFTAGSVAPAGSTLLTSYGSLAQGTRTGYRAAGVAGSIVIHNSMLPTPAPATLVVNTVLVNAPAKAGKATSAVVAAGNVAQATVAGTPVAVPAVVAQVAGQVTAAIVAATAKPAATGKTAAQRNAHGKTA